LDLELIPSEHELTKLHTFRFKLETEGQLYVRLRKGVTVQGGFALKDDYDKVLPVPIPMAQIQIQGAGGVLTLGASASWPFSRAMCR